MEEQRKQQGGAMASEMPAQQREAQTVDLIELLYRLIGSWKLIVGVAIALAVMIGLYTVLFVTPTYEATSTIYVLSRKDEALNMSDLQVGAALMSDYIKVFDMWEVNEAVIANLNLPYNREQLEKMRTISNDSGTRMLDITVKSSSAEEAAAIANEYVEVASQYIADNMATERPSLMSEALVPTKPVAPRKLRSVVLGFMVGFLLAAGAVTVHMLIDDTYKTAEDIRKYAGMATLAVVPAEAENLNYREKRSKKGAHK